MLDRGRSFIGDEDYLALRFLQACFNFEKQHGHRAANDPQESACPAIIYRDAARAASPGGKENGEGYLHRVAPSDFNARIGASISEAI